MIDAIKPHQTKGLLMTTDNTYQIDQTYQVNRTERDNSPKAALTRIKLILDTPSSLDDDRGFMITTNDVIDQAQSFIRDNLDLTGLGICSDWGYDHLPHAFAQHILDDLAIIWGYEFYRDAISELAMGLSLCPMHFVDWAICFDDADPSCAQIRECFPYSHDT